ncbi:hypothetical protein [Kitasatospora herbaricolor]|uniref:Uncharacterized protein n=1 Tax=Kitasatospora herbaricolor TaxID=68217 RepID=A0ABZ1WJQ4_9ACTN|nr:hypothetical protein [Kitasatospora herbaricolor]
MAQDMWDKPDEWLDGGADGAGSAASAVGVLRRQVAEACADVREQAARMRAGLPPDPLRLLRDG